MGVWLLNSLYLFTSPAPSSKGNAPGNKVNYEGNIRPSKGAYHTGKQYSTHFRGEKAKQKVTVDYYH